MAGKCLASEKIIDGNPFICVVLKDSETGRYEDSEKLYKAVLDTPHS